MLAEYEQFISSKTLRVPPSGFEPTALSADLFPFQAQVVRWAVRQGRAALFLDTGMGKTRCQLEWAHQVSVHTGKPVLILAPLAVAQQTVREAARCHVAGTAYARDEGGAIGPIVVTNYERLDRFDASTFGGVVLDESSILKAYSGSTKRAIFDAFARTPYKLACTATPAPNDHLELGNHAEFLDVMSSHQMIARWFINDTSTFGTYRLKGHAVEDFWDWVSSWAVMGSLPSDLGDFSDSGYVLPDLVTHEHVVDAEDGGGADVERGTLFRTVELNATSVHGERRRTADARAGQVAAIVAAEPHEPWLLWCETDYEADAVRAAVADVLPGLVEVRGPDSPDKKELRLVGFADGSIPALLTKPKIAGFGLNLQHCARVVFVGATYSFESYYQAIRRVWRFGQQRPVHVHVVMASTERPVWAILERKRGDFETMKSSMFDAARRNRRAYAKPGTYAASVCFELPRWMRRD
jgi:hypothetical protein